MKKRIRIISLITAIILLVLAIASAVVLIPDRKDTEETEAERVIADTENTVGSIPPISQDEDADIREEKAEIELDIENIPRDTDPSVKNCEIEYGRKETEKIDNGE